MLSNEEDSAKPEVVGGCYRVEAELGRGGMAHVYRVVDLRSNAPLALKQLSAPGDHNATARAMFEQEYYALVALTHPHIVRAFDYGVDAAGPYYTMELLEGADVRTTVRRSPTAVDQVCRLLRDAASALALIHSRRMLHRDLSARNIWCTQDGRAKLIDFGTLVPFGTQTKIAGTPPFVPPEAVYSQPLDARCDIYALGALAYYMLTRRNAYPARQMRELKQHWQRRPPRPIALRAELPKALSDLVMAMLSLDPRGRPASAAEVYERLTALADLPVEDERHVARAFLSSPVMVGRAVPAARIRQSLARTIRGHGGSLSVIGAPGIGRSRMLSHAVLEAKLMGAAVAHVDAAASNSTPLSVAGAIAEQLLDVLPAAAAPSPDQAAILGHISEAVHAALGGVALAEQGGFGTRRRHGTALVGWIEEASDVQPIVIAVDDVQRADSASLGALAWLSQNARDRRLLLLVTLEDDTAHAAPALQQLAHVDGRIGLAPLTLEHTRELLRSLFGNVPGVEDAAHWLHELSQGSPQTCMQYAQYLVDRGIAHYEGGRWRLPARLRQHALPETLSSMLEDEVRNLGDDARAIALGLALSRDETRSSWQRELHLHLEELPQLLEQADGARAFAALGELVRRGIVELREGQYVLPQGAMADALRRLADDETRREMHARLADIYGDGSYDNPVPAVRQLQLAGQHTRARRMLVDFLRRSSHGATDWGALRISVSSECALDALAHWDAQRDPALDAILLRRMLLLTSGVYDWRNADCGREHIERLRMDSGIEFWDQTDPSASDAERLQHCMQLARERYDRTPPAERGLLPDQAIHDIGSSCLSLSGAFVNRHDVELARQLPRELAPFRAFSPLSNLLADLCVMAVERVEGRDVGDRILVNVGRLVAATELADVLRMGAAAVYTHVQVLEWARRGRRSAVELIDRFASATGDDLFLVIHGRWLAHAFRGESAEAQNHRRRVEGISEDDLWRRKGQLFIEAQLHVLTGDLLALGRVSEEIAELASKLPGWRPWFSWTLAEQHRLRGELELAQEQLDRGLELAPPGDHRAWVQIAPAHAEVTLARGDAARALELTDGIVEAVQRSSLDGMAAVGAHRVAALAHSALGDHAEARTAFRRALALALDLSYDGLPLAQLYEVQARIALAAGDGSESAVALASLRRLIEHADAPQLINAYESLREESVRHLDATQVPAKVAPSRATHSEPMRLMSRARSSLGAIEGPHERARRALDLLMEDAQADAGYLFLFGSGGLFAAASTEDELITTELLPVAQRYVELELVQARSASATTVGPHQHTVTRSPSSLRPPGFGPSSMLTEHEARVTAVLLCDRAELHPMLVGVALLARGGASSSMPRSELVQVVSECLLSAGDSVAVPLRD